MPLRPDMDFHDFLPILSRRKWIIILSFLFVFFGAIVYTLITPKLYRSTTTILIVPQPVPENYVRSTVTLGVEDRLPTIGQQVTSRTRLRNVMSTLGLFRKEQETRSQDDVVEDMKDRIEIEVAQDRRRDQRVPYAEVFSISFMYEDPKLAMLTAAKLASTFIDENLKSRERQAVETSALLESQLRGTKAKLETEEEKLKQYKLQYLGALPQELQTNMNTLTRLQQQFGTNATEISATESKKVLLQSQLALIEKGPQAIIHDDGSTEVDTSQEAAQALATQLALKRSELAQISAKYTERHPDVMRIRREVEELERKLADAPMSAQASNGRKKGAPTSRTYLPLAGKEREEFRRLKQQIAAAEAETATLREERANIQKQIAIFQAKVDQAPRREQELVSLTRDYENLRKTYDDLLKKKMDAEMSQALEMRQQGEQFQILDPANLPEKPFKPDRNKVFAIALVAASILGFGGALGLEKIDLTLRGVTDFKHFFDVPVLACIPILDSSEADRRRIFRRHAMWAGIISIAFFLLAFLLVFGDKLRNVANH